MQFGAVSFAGPSLNYTPTTREHQNGRYRGSPILAQTDVLPEVHNTLLRILRFVANYLKKLNAILLLR
jgi:hypothetical protein